MVSALIASGITDGNMRTAHLKQLDQLESEARKAICGASTTFEIGYIVREWLKEIEINEGLEAAEQIVILIQEKFTDSRKVQQARIKPFPGNKPLLNTARSNDDAPL